MTLKISNNTDTQSTPANTLIVPDEYVQAIKESTKDLNPNDAVSFILGLVNFLDPYDDGSGRDDDYILNGNIADIFKNAGLGNTAADVQRILSNITAPHITDVFGDASTYTIPYPEDQPYTITGNTGTPDYMSFINSIIGDVNSTGNNAFQVAGALSGAASDFSNINAQGLNVLLGSTVGFENGDSSAGMGNIFGTLGNIF